MIQDLQERIREAEAIDAEARRKERIREELPELRAEEARRQQEDQARATLAAVRADVRQALEAYWAKLPTFRAEFLAYVEEGERLAAQLVELEDGIPEVAQRLAGAIQRAQRVGIPTNHPAAVWCELGWCDLGLEALPDRDDGRVFRNPDFDEKLGALLAEKGAARVYEPRAGIRSAGVKA